MSNPLHEERVELPRFVESIKVVIAPDMDGADENLRNCHASVCSLHHLGALVTIAGDIDLRERSALAAEEVLRCNAIWTIRGRVNLDGGHGIPVGGKNRHTTLYGGAEGCHNSSKHKNIDAERAGTQQDAGAGVDSCA